MKPKSIEAEFAEWMDEHMVKGGSDVPARVVTVMALLERLREKPELNVAVHITKSGMQLEDHNGYVERALHRFSITSPVTELGRRSSNLHGWIGPILDWLKVHNFESIGDSKREDLLNLIEALAAARLQIINQGKPLIARFNKGTAVAVLGDILDQAQEKNRAKDVAEYLVGAKLQLKFGNDAVTPKNVNTPNRKQPADFRINNAAIKVTVNPADTRHLKQISKILKDTRFDIWLLVRLRDREKWQNVVDASFTGAVAGRIAVTDIETFVGQNVSEIGQFDPTATIEILGELFRAYNQTWLPAAGSAGLQIQSSTNRAKSKIRLAIG